MAYLETPSRILRRMEALEAQDFDLPSLPSMPAFEDSAFHSVQSSSNGSLSSNALPNEEDEDEVPIHSTPAPPSSHTTRSTMRPPPSTSSSATRFANSMRASLSTTRKSQVEQEESFEVSRILPPQHDSDGSSTSASIPDIYLPPENASEDITDFQRDLEDDLSLGDALEPVDHSPSPPATAQYRTPGSKIYDYSISLRSEPKASPINPLRNVSIRKPVISRTRTPSLSRTTPSPTSTSSNSTPRSTYSNMARGVTPPAVEPTTPEDPQTHSVSVEPDPEYEGASGMQSFRSPRGGGQNLVRGDGNGTRSEHDHQDSSPEPTFSSDEQLQSSGPPGARTPFPKAFSSPPPSTLSTPTPAHALHSPDSPVDATPLPAGGPAEVPQDLTTPYNRRRSFLLSLVHSTTRPRMTFPTPHPNSRAAPTPRPRAHPLSQAWTPSPAQFASEARSNPSSGSSLSPHDRLSFISTASSHDLTVHPRANTSFDPVTGPKGIGRFNAVKLNTYLHGLNRRLQEENEMLVGRLRMHGEEVELGKVAEELEREGFKGVEDAVLHEVETMRDELERSEQQKADVLAERDALYDEVETLKNDGEEIKAELESEREERKKDKERWKNRMAEVESGIEGVIKELERRLEEAELAANGKIAAEEQARKLEEKCAAFQDELAIANLRAEKAEDALASSSDLGVEIKQANDLAAAHREEARAANERAHDLELRLQDADEREADIKASLEDQIAEMEAELRQSMEAQQSAEAHAIELEAEAKATDNHIEELEEQLSTVRESAADLQSENGQLQAQLNRMAEDSVRAMATARQMEDALEESERKMISDEEALAALRAKVNHLERELEARRERSKSSVIPDPDPSQPHNLEAEQLEAELDDAHREIAKLNYLLSESPSRKAIEKAKDMRIELLEREKEELSERVRAFRVMMSPSPAKTASSAMNTPLARRHLLASKSPLTPGAPLKDYSWLHGSTPVSNSSPLIAQIAHLQQELNLANDSIDVKVDKIEEAGMDIVGLTGRLEDAKSRIIALEEEIGRLMRREDRQMRRMERVRCSECGGRVDLSMLKGANADQSSIEQPSTMLSSNPSTPPSKTVESLRVALKTVNSQLHTLKSQWDGEKKQLLGEKAVLQDAAKRLNVELGAAKHEVKQALETGRQDVNQEARARTSVESELSKARAVVNDLENALKGERSRLRALSTEQTRIGREKEGILVQLQRARGDMDEVKGQLEQVKSENRELEAELRAMATVDQKAQLLEAKVADNQKVIEQLREERESLTADHAGLQRRYVDASAHVNRLRQELANSQKSHDERRHQLDQRVAEIEGLRRELTYQAQELERIELEKNKARSDRSGIIKNVASLESDLKRVRSDAEALGRDLRQLKSERDRLETKHRDELGKADRAQKQLYAQIRVSNEQLEAQREKTNKAIAELKSHVCELNQETVDKIHVQHKNECKGLMVQIRYLKAKFTRESLFRADLGYQKHYLLDILASFEKSEKQILAAVARIGFPSQPAPARKRRTLRTIAVAALFIAKARRASDAWREQSASKSAIAAALQDVRRRRAAGSVGYI